MTTGTRHALLLVGAALGALAPATARAQTAIAPSTSASVGDADTIVVTAQRRVENPLTVPVTESVVRPEQLRDYGAAGGDTLLSLSGKVPDLVCRDLDRTHLPALLHPRAG